MLGPIYPYGACAIPHLQYPRQKGGTIPWSSSRDRGDSQRSVYGHTAPMRRGFGFSLRHTLPGHYLGKSITQDLCPLFWRHGNILERPFESSDNAQCSARTNGSVTQTTDNVTCALPLFAHVTLYSLSPTTVLLSPLSSTPHPTIIMDAITNARTIDDVIHDLWDNAPAETQQEYAARSRERAAQRQNAVDVIMAEDDWFEDDDEEEDHDEPEDGYDSAGTLAAYDDSSDEVRFFDHRVVGEITDMIIQTDVEDAVPEYYAIDVEGAFVENNDFEAMDFADLDMMMRMLVQTYVEDAVPEYAALDVEEAFVENAGFEALDLMDFDVMVCSLSHILSLTDL